MIEVSVFAKNVFLGHMTRGFFIIKPYLNYPMKTLRQFEPRKFNFIFKWSEYYSNLEDYGEGYDENGETTSDKSLPISTETKENIDNITPLTT